MIEIKFKYLYVNTSRHGTKRYYYRQPGRPLVRLPDIADPAFHDAYHRAAVAGPIKPKTSAGKITPGSFRDLWVKYKTSPDFAALAESTKAQKTRVMESILLERIGPTSTALIGEGPASQISPKVVRYIRDLKANAPEAANHRLKTMRNLFAWACENDVMDTNPARDVKPISAATDGHHTWTEEEVGQYLKTHQPGTKARLAMCLLLFLGIRISDLALIGPDMVRDGEISFVPYKTRGKKKTAMVLPVLPALQMVIDQSEIGDKTFMVTEYGKPFSIKGLGQWFRKRCDEAGLTHCSAHGLRKAGATIAAENGATEEQLKAIFGWENAKEANLYTRKARQKLIASGAMSLLSFGDSVNIHIGKVTPNSGCTENDEFNK
ncbi:tyrosine-type recombinase/integrase [Allorhizobium sp. BGMRC 0089]|uniref:tyrosine-type recombinase/integrase n=1 Tax=Allorhizobium sonneratiae TaxID=2934936 RepID=UPI002033FA8A|nr:tyrosine-type recombinase/integrase [Allorhizobium sonneratiae]MCM2294787.1 tyrosine-type recombinase/integrase [Allorhizobium sonneratiae]